MKPDHPAIKAFSLLVDDFDRDIQQEHSEKNLGEKKKIRESILFYRQFVGIVDVVGPTDQLHKVYFQKPLIMNYLDNVITEDIVHNTVRTSDEERIEHFSSKVRLYQRIMEYRRNIDEVPGLLWLCNSYESIKKMVFMILLFNNIIMLFTFKYEDSMFSTDQDYEIYFKIAHSFNTGLAAAIYILGMV